MRVTGVRVQRRGETIDITARETIVSMGALQSPAFLMRNGIGPAKELAALGIGVTADRPGVGKHLMEHPGVNFGCYLKPEARLAPTMRRQMFAGLRFSSKLDGCPAGDMYIIPSNKAAWHGIGHRLGLLMMWVNRSYSTGEVRAHLVRSIGETRRRFQHVLGLARHGAHAHRRAHDDQAAGAPGRAAHLRADLSGQLQRPRAHDTPSTAAPTKSRWRSAAG